MATAEELRRWREDTSLFSRLFDYVRENEAALAAEGRRPVLGGLLSKEPVMGVDTIRYEGIGPMIAGLLDPVARGLDAPRAAAEGLIPAEDMTGEAFGTAGAAMFGGGAVARPSGSLGANTLRVYHGTDADISQLQSGYGRTARDLYTTPIKDDAAAYGKNVLQFDVEGKVGNFLPDNRGIKETKLLSKAYKDYGLDDYFDSFDDFLDAFDSGDMYQRTGSSAAQDEVVGALIDVGGFDAIRIPDAGFGGAMSESVVAQNPNVFKPVMANASKSAGLLGVASDGFLDRLIRADDIPAKTDAQKTAKEILQLREQGRASEVTKEMMEAADPQIMALYTPLDMSANARMARARELGFEDQTYYHGAKDTPELPYFDSIDEYNTEGHIGTVYGTSSPAVANTYLRKSSDDENAIYPLMVRRDPNDPTINVDGVYSRIPMSIKDEKGRSLMNVLPDAAEMDHLNAERVTNTDAIANAMRDADFSMLRMENVIDRGPYYPDAAPFGFQAKSYKDIERQNEFNKWNREMLAEANQPATNVMVQDARKLRSKFARFDPEFSHLPNLTAANMSPLGGLLAQSGVSDDQAQRIEDYLYKTGLLQ